MQADAEGTGISEREHDVLTKTVRSALLKSFDLLNKASVGSRSEVIVHVLACPELYRKFSLTICLTVPALHQLRQVLHA